MFAIFLLADTGQLVNGLPREVMTLIILGAFFIITLFAAGFARDIQKSVREVLRRLDINDIEREAADSALNKIFAENKMTNGESYLDHKRKQVEMLLKAYDAKKGKSK